MPIIKNPGTYEVNHTAVNGTSDGDNTVIAAVTGKKIRVLGYVLHTDAAGQITVKDSSTTHAIFDMDEPMVPISFAGGIFCPAFETGTGLALIINTQSSQDVSGHITYQLV